MCRACQISNVNVIACYGKFLLMHTEVCHLFSGDSAKCNNIVANTYRTSVLLHIQLVTLGSSEANQHKQAREPHSQYNHAVKTVTKAIVGIEMSVN